MRKEYETYLNTLSGDVPPDGWVLGGVMRTWHQKKGLYGTALFMFEPDMFYKRFRQWKIREIKRKQLV